MCVCVCVCMNEYGCTCMFVCVCDVSVCVCLCVVQSVLMVLTHCPRAATKVVSVCPPLLLKLLQ